MTSGAACPGRALIAPQEHLILLPYLQWVFSTGLEEWISPNFLALVEQNFNFYNFSL